VFEISASRTNGDHVGPSMTASPSIEMFDGRQANPYWPSLFRQRFFDSLKQGRQGALQIHHVSTTPVFESYPQTASIFHRQRLHFFPGGMLPGENSLPRSSSPKRGLRHDRRPFFGQDLCPHLP